MTDTYRITFVTDEDAQFEECNGEARPLTEAEYTEYGAYYRDGRPIPYAEYRAYYGDPDRHVYLRSVVERRCGACGHWAAVGGTGWIDFMDDNPELQAKDRPYTEDEIATLPGYLRTIAEEDLAEVRGEEED